MAQKEEERKNINKNGKQQTTQQEYAQYSSQKRFAVTFLFVCLIIRTFQLVFSAKIVFFSHTKSSNSTFSHDFSAKRTNSRGRISLWDPSPVNSAVIGMNHVAAIEARPDPGPFGYSSS
jgi:hypothetical protein